MIYLPGNTNMNNAARTPRADITIPMFGKNAAISNDVVNHVMAIIYLLLLSPRAISSGISLRRSTQILSTPVLKHNHWSQMNTVES